MLTTTTSPEPFGESSADAATSGLERSEILSSALSGHSPTCAARTAIDVSPDGTHFLGKAYENYRHGYPWSLSFAAAFRHMSLALSGVDVDEENGSKHVIAAAWHMLTLAHYMNRPDLREKYDDRQDKMERETLD